MTEALLQQFTTALASTRPQPVVAYRSAVLGNTMMCVSGLLGASGSLFREAPPVIGGVAQVHLQLSGGIPGCMEPSRPGPSPTRPARRERELGWLRTHRDALQKFTGEWIVLSGEEIVAHSPDPSEAMRQARVKGVRSPLVYRVEGKRPEGVGRFGL